jgi:AAA domain
MKHYGVSEFPGNLIFVPCPFNFQEQSEVLELMQVAETDLGTVPSFIVVDTLARNFGSGNENDPRDMNTFIRCLDLLRNTYDCTVATVHHTGKDETRGARGHTALIAACDTIITLEESTTERGRGCLVSCTKQKDFEPFEPYILTQEIIAVGQDRHGNDLTSLVLIGQEQWTTRFQLLPKDVKELLHMLFTNFNTEPFGWSQGYKASGYSSRDTFRRRFKKLQDKKFVVTLESLYRVNKEACSILLTQV